MLVIQTLKYPVKNFLIRRALLYLFFAQLFRVLSIMLLAGAKIAEQNGKIEVASLIVKTVKNVLAVELPFYLY